MRIDYFEGQCKRVSRGGGLLSRSFRSWVRSRLQSLKKVNVEAIMFHFVCFFLLGFCCLSSPFPLYCCLLSFSIVFSLLSLFYSFVLFVWFHCLLLCLFFSLSLPSRSFSLWLFLIKLLLCPFFSFLSLLARLLLFLAPCSSSIFFVSSSSF